jgi:hypothetical protein
MGIMEIDYLQYCRLQSFRYYFPEYNIETILKEDKN